MLGFQKPMPKSGFEPSELGAALGGPRGDWPYLALR